MYIRAQDSFYAVATLSRGALLSLQPLQPFSSLQPFRSKNHLRFCRTFAPVPFCRLQPCACFMLHASCFAVPLRYLCGTFCRSFAAKRFQGSFYTVLSRFKRSQFSACTFVHFAPLQAVTWQQTRQNAVIRGGGGTPLGRGARGATKVAQNFVFSDPEKIFSEKISCLQSHAF